MKRGTKSTKQKDLKKKKTVLKSFQCIILKRKILQESPLFVLAMKWAGRGGRALPLGKDTGLALKCPQWEVNFVTLLGGVQGLQLQLQPIREIMEPKL